MWKGWVIVVTLSMGPVVRFGVASAPEPREKANMVLSRIKSSAVPAVIVAERRFMSFAPTRAVDADLRDCVTPGIRQSLSGRSFRAIVSVPVFAMVVRWPCVADFTFVRFTWRAFGSGSSAFDSAIAPSRFQTGP